MALEEIQLSDLVDELDEEQNDYANFFRPMLGYDAFLTLYEGIDDSFEPLLAEVEDEVGYEFPPDLIALYICSNGGKYGGMTLFPLTNDKDVSETINKLNVFDKSLKASLGLNNATLLLGRYGNLTNYVICYLKDEDTYSYAVYNGEKKEIRMEFESIAELVALEVSYVADYDGFMDYINKGKENK